MPQSLPGCKPKHSVGGLQQGRRLIYDPAHQHVSAMVATLCKTAVITGTIPADLRRRQHSGKVVAVS
jgi:hypothetical protein